MIILYEREAQPVDKDITEVIRIENSYVSLLSDVGVGACL